MIYRRNIKRFNNFILPRETASGEVTIPNEVINPKILAEMITQRLRNILTMIVTPEATTLAIKNMRESRS